MTSWQEDCITLLDDCKNRETRLTDWERGFVDSLRRQVDEGRRPTPPQLSVLDEIWEHATKKG